MFTRTIPIVIASFAISPLAHTAPATKQSACSETDAQKLGAVVTALHATHRAEIAAAQTAVDRAVSTDVRTYATRVLERHKEADARVMAWMKKNGPVTMLQRPVERAMLAMQSARTNQLEGKTGSAFDATYLTSEPIAQEFLVHLTEEGRELAQKDEAATKLLRDVHKTSMADRDAAQKLVDRMVIPPSAIGGGPRPFEPPGLDEPSSPRLPPKIDDALPPDDDDNDLPRDFKRPPPMDTPL